MQSPDTYGNIVPKSVAEKLIKLRELIDGLCAVHFLWAFTEVPFLCRGENCCKWLPFVLDMILLLGPLAAIRNIRNAMVWWVFYVTAGLVMANCSVYFMGEYMRDMFSASVLLSLIVLILALHVQMIGKIIYGDPNAQKEAENPVDIRIIRNGIGKVDLHTFPLE